MFGSLLSQAEGQGPEGWGAYDLAPQHVCKKGCRLPLC